MVVGEVQLRFTDATVRNALTEGLQPTTVRLNQDKVYALCRSGGKKPVGAVPLVVTCPKVSSVHCLISYDASRECWLLTDGDGFKRPSTNGTYINGTRVAPRDEDKLPGTTDLLPGTTISIKVSSVGMHFELTPEAEAQAAESAAAVGEQETTEEASATAAATTTKAAAAAAAVSASAAVAATAAAAGLDDDDDDDDDDDNGAFELPTTAATPKEVIVWQKRPDGTSELLGAVPLRLGEKRALALHKEVTRQGLGAAFRNGQFQFLKPMKAGAPPTLPIWEPQEKGTLIIDLLHASPDRNLPSGNCITIRSLPLHDDESIDDDDESVSSALKQPVPPNKGKKANGVAQERAAPAATSALPAAKRMRANLKDDDPDDPKPPTAWDLFKQERSAALDAACGAGPKPTKAELHKRARQEWDSDPAFAGRRRELEELQNPKRDAWNQKRKQRCEQGAAAAETSTSAAQPGFVTPDSLSGAPEEGHARGHAKIGAFHVEDIDY